MKHISTWAAFFLTASMAVAAPEIQFDKDVFDFGVVYKNGITNGEFAFHNIGNQDLIIQNAKPDCGCTVARVLPEIIHPGEGGKVAFTLQLNEVDGAAEKGIMVTSNDPKKPGIKLKIRAESKPLYYCSPDELTLDALPPGRATNFVVSVQRADRQKIKLNKIDSSDNYLTADVDEQSDPTGLTVNMWVHLKARPEGSFRSYLLIYAGKDTLPSFFFNINGNVLPNVSLNTESLFWGIARPDLWTVTNAMAARTIEVTSNRPGNPVKISRVSSDIPDLDLHIVQAVSPAKITIIARLLELPARSLSGAITVELDSVRHEVLHLPVKIEIQGR